MNCPNCGKKLNEGVKFCNGCGTPITTPEQNQNVQPMQNTQQVKKQTNSTNIFVACILFMLNLIIKPVKTFKAKINEFENPKNGFIFIGLVSAISMVIRVVITFLLALINRPCTTWAGKKECVSIDESLKNIQWADITIKHLLGVIIIALAIAGIYYLASLVAKKNTKYMKLAVISTAAMIPFLLTSYFLAPILSWIFSLLKISELVSIFIVIISIVYSLTVFYTLMKEEINFDDKDMVIYFYSLITIIIIIISYFVLKNMLINQIGNEIGMGLGSSGLGSILK